MEAVCAERLRWFHAALFVLPFAAGPDAEAACIDPAALSNSTVSLTRHFGDDERTRDPTLLGVRGTAWFLSPRLAVTAAHVAKSMGLSSQDWKELEIHGGGKKAHSDLVRIQRFAGEEPEKIAVLEFESTFPAAQPLQIRIEPLIAGEPAASIAYPGDRLRFASGRFVRQGEGNTLAGIALFEMTDGNDRLVLDHGASGAPVIDCEGRAVAVVTNVFAKTMSFMSQIIRISTSWGSPNVAAVPITVLEGAPAAE